mgnify:CR=1 FL=1
MFWCMLPVSFVLCVQVPEAGSICSERGKLEVVARLATAVAKGLGMNTFDPWGSNGFENNKSWGCLKLEVTQEYSAFGLPFNYQGCDMFSLDIILDTLRMKRYFLGGLTVVVDSTTPCSNACDVCMGKLHYVDARLCSRSGGVTLHGCVGMLQALGECTAYSVEQYALLTGAGSGWELRVGDRADQKVQDLSGLSRLAQEMAELDERMPDTCRVLFTFEPNTCNSTGMIKATVVNKQLLIDADAAASGDDYPYCESSMGTVKIVHDVDMMGDKCVFRLTKASVSWYNVWLFDSSRISRKQRQTMRSRSGLRGNVASSARDLALSNLTKAAGYPLLAVVCSEGQEPNRSRLEVLPVSTDGGRCQLLARGYAQGKWIV